MKNRGTRLAALEAKRGEAGKVHRIVFHEGETDTETEANRSAALDDYGRELIGPDDLLIQMRVAAPRFDAGGKMIPRVRGQLTTTEGNDERHR